MPPQDLALLTINELAPLLKLSRVQIERLIPLGLPCLDARGPGRPGARAKRTLRFRLEDVLDWMEKRGTQSTASSTVRRSA
jgi:hypothetical protein